MSRPLVPIGLTVVVVCGTYLGLRTFQDALPPPVRARFNMLDAQVQQLAHRVHPRLGSTVSHATSPHAATKPGASRPAASTKPGSPAKKSGRVRDAENAPVVPLSAPLKNPMTLYLTNGGAVTGELVSETPQQVVLRWDYGDVAFQRAEIARAVKGKEGTNETNITMPWEGAGGQWAYQHDVVLKLMKGTVLDREITRVTSDSIMLSQSLPGGGTVEQTIQRADLETLLFRPIHNARSDEIAAALKQMFPAMQWHEEGMFTIITDSTPPTVKEYRKTIRELATDWYLTFYPLTKGRQPAVQQYLVLFENWDAYIEYAATDGVPGWLAVGYFSPTDEVLYSFNMLGERFSDLLYEVYLGRFRRARDTVSAHYKGSPYELTVEGQLSEFLQKLEQAHGMVRQIYSQLSIDVLRHELTHAMFHNWHLQGIVLSQVAKRDDETIKQKRQFLDATDVEQKRALLEGLLSKNTGDRPQMQAANSWYVEGIAGYMEPAPVGAVNQIRLAEAQQARTTNQVLPLEFLNTFRIGSFSGMATQSALYAYAQSWALCHFLMHRYSEGFLAYLDRLAREHPAEGQDTLAWLLQAVGREQRPLEQEFLAYLDQFPPEDPAWLKQMQLFIDLRSELTTLFSRMGG